MRILSFCLAASCSSEHAFLKGHTEAKGGDAGTRRPASLRATVTGQVADQAGRARRSLPTKR